MKHSNEDDLSDVTPEEAAEVNRLRRLTPEQEAEFVRLVSEPSPFLVSEDEARVVPMGSPILSGAKFGLAEIDGEVHLVPQEGETLRVPRAVGTYVWDGMDDKGHCARMSMGSVQR